jgi:hypothetical protein
METAPLQGKSLIGKAAGAPINGFRKDKTADFCGLLFRGTGGDILSKK